MVPSVSVHMRATGIWPTTKSTALWTTGPGAIAPSSPASMGIASQSNGSVTTIMTVVMAVMSWKLSVVSPTLRAFVRKQTCLYAKCLLHSPSACE